MGIVIEYNVATGMKTEREMTAAESATITSGTHTYSCTPWQIRKALNAMNLRQAVEDAVAASTDKTLKDGWEFATEFRSDDPFVLQMGAAIGKSSVETAELIKQAAAL